MTTPSKTKRASSTKPSKRSQTSSNNTVHKPAPSKKSRGVFRSLVRRIQTFSDRYDLFHRGDSFVLGISGGADSVFLLHVLLFLQKKYDFSLVLAHVNYRLRGKDSAEDELFVQNIAQQYHLPLFILRPTFTRSGNLEEKLRHIRYDFFEKIRVQQNAHFILTAHHEDDQIETFLLRLLRGSGMQGLSAILPKQDLIVRPLLGISKNDILSALSEQSILFRTDLSNFDTTIPRNKLRHDLIPYLEKEYQPNIRKILAHTTSLLSQDYALLKQAISGIYTPLIHTEKSGFSFSLQDFLLLEEFHQRQFLRFLFQKAIQSNLPPSRSSVEETLKSLKKDKNKPQTLCFPGLILRRKGDKVSLISTH